MRSPCSLVAASLASAFFPLAPGHAVEPPARSLVYGILRDDNPCEADKSRTG